MGWILGIISGLILLFLLAKYTYHSHLGRILGIVISTSMFIYMKDHCADVISAVNNYDFDDVPFLLAYVDTVLNVLFLFRYLGIVYIICEIFSFIIKIIPKSSKKPKPISNTTRWVLTIIHIIIAIICVCTVILIPVAYACANNIKHIWDGSWD